LNYNISTLAHRENDNRGSVYLVFEYLEHDLHGIIDSGVKLDMPHIKCLLK